MHYYIASKRTHSTPPGLRLHVTFHHLRRVPELHLRCVPEIHATALLYSALRHRKRLLHVEALAAQGLGVFEGRRMRRTARLRRAEQEAPKRTALGARKGRAGTDTARRQQPLNSGKGLRLMLSARVNGTGATWIAISRCRSQSPKPCTWLQLK